MTAPQDHDQVLLAAGGAATVLIRNKERITRLFAERVLAMLQADGQTQSHPMTVDTLPAFLTTIALALSPANTRATASDDSNIALLHGAERAKLTSYSLAQLIKDYQILREIVLELFAHDETFTSADWATIHRSIDQAIAEAASAFVQVHETVRNRFAAALTHDFRGPLGAAANYIELIRRAGEKPEQRAHFALRALDNLKRMNLMIDDLLDASRAHSGERLSIRPVDCDLARLARNLLEDLAGRDADRFVLDCDRPVPAYCDCERIRQGLHNLLDNAMKYGSPHGPITVRLVEGHGRVTLSVHNFGDPIAPEEKSRLFEAYRRTASAERSGKKGWGLGLVLVQAIAEAHGGSVGVESTADEGTTFTLDILRDVRDLNFSA